MIDSVLVANRGEIAVRIFRTARRLGLRTVAVYSDADAGSRHVRAADVAIRLGPAPARESYLDIARVLEAARISGARAIHPGYGFLSENAQFAQACAAAGLVFIGPPAQAIAAMGSKILAKTRMQAAGVPVLPGYAGDEQQLEQLAARARAAGLPLIIKPAAGGGGKGMQIVRTEAEVPAALAAARRLAQSAFGDGDLLLERYLPGPRHVEVQVFADSHGNFVHLGERDCSTQRRHQKLLEEAPAPGVPQEVRERLRAAALVVAREIGYVGAGTVEFLYDGAQFYFMEMNTRLQVEHTVTEAITGLDLVEWQLRVAAGEPLPLSQEQIHFNGHAIEARVCAEDPEHGFLPSAGRLALLQWPQHEQVRVDAGFASGDVVPDSYDSLLGKVIAWAPTRAQASARLAAALDDTSSAGVKTNDHWLARLVRSEPFASVRHTIASLDAATAPAAAGQPAAHLLVLAALAAQADGLVSGANDPWAARDGFVPNLPARVGTTLVDARGSRQVLIEYRDGVPAAAVLAGEDFPLAEVTHTATGTAGLTALVARIGAQRIGARYFHQERYLRLWSGSDALDFTLEDPRTGEYAAAQSSGSLTTPLPGVVVSVPVSLGQQVTAGELLMVIEAMKMEHAIIAPYDGEVAAIHFTPGQRVPEGSALLALNQKS
ncbi:MAG: ATP-grasp domain-containing protein [Proteobacteria bacterium]|nr:ATP-grasp domain-containing protein [Pseudomonadota bacterium]